MLIKSSQNAVSKVCHLEKGVTCTVLVILRLHNENGGGGIGEKVLKPHAKKGYVRLGSHIGMNNW